MSMLAEKKTKQKWSLNPRGKAWSEDSNKFGQKILEKMGWSHGKGLGAKEDGTVEHVKVSYKNDSKGMGYKESNDQWTEHDSKFNALLQSLSGEVERDIKLTSLEQKSEKSKVRVHYKKFTRGKDLSRCSEKDLANIFGKRSLKETSPQPEESEDTRENSGDGFIRNGGSMVDYFKRKIPGFGKSNGYTIGNNGVLKKDTDSEEEGYVGFGFKRKLNGEVPNGTPKKIKCESEDVGVSNPAFEPMFGKVEVHKHFLNTITEENDEEIEKKARKMAIGEEKMQLGENEDSYTNESFEIKRKKKKKKKGDANFEENSHLSEDLEVKKKKRKSNDTMAVDNPNFEEGNIFGNIFQTEENGKSATDSLNFEDSCSQNSCEVKRKKKKKNKEDSLEDNSKVKRKINVEENTSLAIDNPNFDDTDTQNGYVNEDFEVPRKKKKKNTGKSIKEDDCYSSFEVKKKHKKEESTNLAIDNPNFEDNDTHSSFINEDFEVPRKNKMKNKEDPAKDNSNLQDDCYSSFEVKRKNRKEEGANLTHDNPNFEDNGISNSYVSEDFEVPRKKKKKKKEDAAIDNPNFQNDDQQDSYVDENFEVKRKKKKKKKTDESSAVDNPIFNGSLSAEDSVISEPSKLEKNEESSSNLEMCDFDLILNVTSTPSIPKGTPKSSTKRKSVRFSKVTEERIIPNNEMNSQVEEMSKKIDGFQAEIENDLNEAKDVKYIGEVGNPDGENEKSPEDTKLKFKYAKFGKYPIWVNKSPASKSKCSYKHLIKGDILLGFKNTNLHEIKGYGVVHNSQ